jgi:hypothetical protein
MFKSLIRLTIPAYVQPRWGEWLRLRDEWRATGTGGSTPRTDGGTSPLSGRAAYAIVTILIVLSACVGTFSNARDISWRHGTPYNLWEPALCESTSAIVIVVLLPLARRGAASILAWPRMLTLGLTLAGLALTYSALHILGMGLLRELAYWLMGSTYAFPWSDEILYEFRKDLFAYTAFVVIFWLAERANIAAPTGAGNTRPEVKDPAANNAEFWLRDGNTSLLIDINEIILVTSAGNYVEYQLTDGRKHLIRTTLQAQETRLAPFGFVRVHRGRLVNLRRIAAVAWRASGDFEVRLDTGDVIPGSRRFKAALASLAN